MRMADSQQNFLSECRVVFLLGPEPVVLDSTLVDSTYFGSTYADTTYLDGGEGEFFGEAEQSRSTE